MCLIFSLRDVERMLTTLDWFHTQSDIIAEKVLEKIDPYNDAPTVDEIFRTNLILALGVASIDQVLKAGAFQQGLPGSLELLVELKQDLEFSGGPGRRVLRGPLALQAADDVGNEHLCRGPHQLVAPLWAPDAAKDPAPPQGGEHLL